MIKVLLTEDHKMLREGIKGLLENAGGISVVAEAGGIREMFAVLAVREVDVIVLDIALPEGNGLDALEEIKAGHPGVAVVVLSMYSEEKYTLRALRCGASAYLAKETASAELVLAIRGAYACRTYPCADLPGRLRGAAPPTRPAEPRPAL